MTDDEYIGFCTDSKSISRSIIRTIELMTPKQRKWDHKSQFDHLRNMDPHTRSLWLMLNGYFDIEFEDYTPIDEVYKKPTTGD